MTIEDREYGLVSHAVEKGLLRLKTETEKTEKKRKGV